jgi:hypothetical protein
MGTQYTDKISDRGGFGMKSSYAKSNTIRVRSILSYQEGESDQINNLVRCFHICCLIKEFLEDNQVARVSIWR